MLAYTYTMHVQSTLYNIYIIHIYVKHILYCITGRSNYLSLGQLNNTPDPGAVAVAQVFVIICKVLNEQCY